MASKLEEALALARQEAASRQPPELDTAAIFKEAQAKAALQRASAPLPLTPEAAATPAVVVEPQEVKPRTDLRRFVQPVTIRGH